MVQCTNTYAYNVINYDHVIKTCLTHAKRTQIVYILALFTNEVYYTSQDITKTAMISYLLTLTWIPVFWIPVTTEVMNVQDTSVRNITIHSIINIRAYYLEV